MVIIIGSNEMRKMIRRPTHPDSIIKEDYLLPLSVTIKDMADTLGREVSRSGGSPDIRAIPRRLGPTELFFFAFECSKIYNKNLKKGNNPCRPFS
jgi:hypothetical protein